MAVTGIDASPNATADAGHGVPFRDAVQVWGRIALLSFGGPAGQIAVMHRILVEEKKWIGEERFLHALNFCMLLPGPEAQQLATYIGWLLHKTVGGLLAGMLFVLPGLISIMALSWIYVLWGNVGAVAGLFFGLKAAVLAIVAQAVFRIGGRALGNPLGIALAVGAFVAIFLVSVPFPAIILSAGLIGYVAGLRGSSAFGAGGGHAADRSASVSDAESALGTEIPAHARPNRSWIIRMAIILLTLWLGPVALIAITLGPDSTFTNIAIFFSKAAMVTFGGAYSVLAYVAQEAVDTYGWLRPAEMLDGLGMAETTPGPLIMVTQFVGFLGAYRNPDGLSPLVAGTLGGLLTTWVTFAPCFLWIFLGAPFVERLRHNLPLAAALSAVSAAVVGVVANLAIWFALHYLFRTTRDQSFGPIHVDLPVLASVDVAAMALSLVGLFAMFRFRLGVFPILGLCAAGGLLIRGATGMPT